MHLQLGEDAKDLNIVVSTLAEAEYVAEYLVKRTKQRGVYVNVRRAVNLC